MSARAAPAVSRKGNYKWQALSNTTVGFVIYTSASLLLALDWMTGPVAQSGRSACGLCRESVAPF